MENILVIPKNEKQLSLIKSLLEEMKISFLSKKEDSSYQNLDKKIKEARKDKQKGQLLTVTSKNLWESI